MLPYSYAITLYSENGKLFKVTPIPAFKDNYIWAIHSPDNCTFTVVDPGEAGPVISYSINNNLKLDAILITHHHADHTAGIPALKSRFKDIAVFGPREDSVDGLTHPLSEGDSVALFGGTLILQVFDIPGHTKGHIAYYGANMVFTGDTLFSSGCGKIFEGTPEQMLSSLNKLKQLPLDTLIYCGHEYTLANIAFAQQLEPHNLALETRLHEAREKRKIAKATLPVSLKTELSTNPFLRCEEPSIIHAVQQHFTKHATSTIEIFTLLREWKNNFTPPYK